jgi:arsenite-transporting ATPase
MAEYVRAQRGYLEEIERSFAPLPVLQVPHLGREVFGLELLRRIGDGLYGERDPAAVFHSEPAFRIEHDQSDYVVALRLPHADAAEVQADQRGDELIVSVDNQRRNISLPSFLAYFRLADTELAEGWLRARFVPGSQEAGSAP